MSYVQLWKEQEFVSLSSMDCEAPWRRDHSESYESLLTETNTRKSIQSEC
jgi:hypothetical protein